MKITKAQLKHLIREELNNQYKPGAKLYSHLETLYKYDLPELAVDERARKQIRNYIRKEYYSRNSPLLFGLYDRPSVIETLVGLGELLNYLTSRPAFSVKDYHNKINEAKQTIASLIREIKDVQQRYRDAQ